mmetsp:Transcript_4143/g.15148  ORF Transcript_4143/g.15148 Transcript_4143/m.15148 type:complete len:211 (+) Transcript_4143:2850-3482(+)
MVLILDNAFADAVGAPLRYTAFSCATSSAISSALRSIVDVQDNVLCPSASLSNSISPTRRCNVADQVYAGTLVFSSEAFAANAASSSSSSLASASSTSRSCAISLSTSARDLASASQRTASASNFNGVVSNAASRVVGDRARPSGTIPRGAGASSLRSCAPVIVRVTVVATRDNARPNAPMTESSLSPALGVGGVDIGVIAARARAKARV